jgi:hypothetical protein
MLFYGILREIFLGLSLPIKVATPKASAHKMKAIINNNCTDEITKPANKYFILSSLYATDKRDKTVIFFSA